ncbi:unnamed protein product, partial [Ixodes hexagonus]
QILKKLEQIRKDIARKERKLQKLKRLSSHRSSASSRPGDESHSSVADDTSPVPREVATLSQREICEASYISRTETALSVSSATSGADRLRNGEPLLQKNQKCSSRLEPTSPTKTPDCQLQRTTLSSTTTCRDVPEAGTTLSHNVARPDQRSEIERIGRLLYSDSPTGSSKAVQQQPAEVTDQALATETSEVQSPLKKKKRPSARLDTTTCPSATGEYNLRKRKVTQSPVCTATKESKMIVNAFSKLVYKACSVPVLPFESCQATVFSLLLQQRSSSGDEADASSQSPTATSPYVNPDCRVRRRRRRSSTKVRPASPSTEDQEEACAWQPDANSRVSQGRSPRDQVAELKVNRCNIASSSLQCSQAQNVSGNAAAESVPGHVSGELGDDHGQTAESLGATTDCDVKPILVSSSSSTRVEVKKEDATSCEGHNAMPAASFKGHSATPAATSDSDETNASLSITTDRFVQPLLHSSKCDIKTECFSNKVKLEDHVKIGYRFLDGVAENHTDNTPALFQNSGKSSRETQYVDVHPSALRNVESPKTSCHFIPSYSESGSEDQLKDLINSVVECLEVEDGSQDDFGRNPIGGSVEGSEEDSSAEEERASSAAEALVRLAGGGLQQQESQALTFEEKLLRTCSDDAEDNEDDGRKDAKELLSMRESDEESQGESFCSAESSPFRGPKAVIGDQNPLMFFCTLKCPSGEPVTDVCILDSAPRVLVAVQARAIHIWCFAGVWHPSLTVTNLQYEIGGQHCILRCGGSSFLVYLNPRVPSHLACVQWDLDTCQSSQLILTCGSDYCTDPKGRLRIYLLTKLGDDCVATASRTISGTSRIRVHRLRNVCGDVGDESDAVGQTSNTLHSLVGVDGLPSALLGNHGNIFYVWDYEEKVLVKKMILEPDCLNDMHRLCWASSDSGLLFLVTRTTDEETCHLLVTNPFTCKSQLVNSYAWCHTSGHATQRQV